MTLHMHRASREQALAAVRAFHAEHCRLPRWREWERASASRPCARTIEWRWGWRELLADALGVRPSAVLVAWDVVPDDRVQAMVTGLRAARDQLRHWPTAAAWDASGRRPTSRTFTWHGGSWREARVAAGPDSTRRSNAVQLRLVGSRSCSDSYHYR
jgi:hypothetical protein